MSAHIQINGVTKRFGAVEAIGGMSLAIAHNEFVTVVGSSGCGKTTLLSIVAGLTAPTGGEVLKRRFEAFAALHKPGCRSEVRRVGVAVPG